MVCLFLLPKQFPVKRLALLCYQQFVSPRSLVFEEKKRVIPRPSFSLPLFAPLNSGHWTAAET
jgi:hypothetical protein